MEFAFGNRDNARLPPLSLGLTSVRLIVNKIEAETARASESDRELVKYTPNIEEYENDCYDYDPPLDATRGRVWSRFLYNLGVALSRCIPSVSFGNFAAVSVAASFVAPRMISYLVLYPLCRLVFGTLYPAYASYKAVRTKNLKEYVKWMMYWIVFALFTCTETFTDVFLSWFPFYYEVKIVLVLWLLSPATKGSSILYRKFVHPALCRREQEIDEYIAKAKDQGYHTVLNLGTKGVNYATTVIMQTAIKGGGGLVQQLRKSYSLSDLSECEPRSDRSADEADDVLTEPRSIRRAVAKSGYNTRRSASESNSRGLYFPEVDVDVGVRGARRDEPDFSHIKSSEDISSGYSSADNSVSLTRAGSLSVDNSVSLTRAGSLSAASRSKARVRTSVTPIKRPPAAEGEVIIEELQADDSFEFENMPPLLNLSQNLYISKSDPPFIYQIVGDQVRIIQVLGSNQSKFNSENDNTDRWDQEAYEDASPTVDETNNECKDSNTAETGNKIDTNKDINTKIELKEESNDPVVTNENNNATDAAETCNNNKIETKQNTTQQNSLSSEVPDKTIDIASSYQIQNKTETEPQPVSKVEFDNTEESKTLDNKETSKVEIKVDDHVKSTSLDTSVNDNNSDDSDDEASFGTPEESPKSKRKSPVSKYGKRKAPPPPVITDKTENDSKNTNEVPTSSTASDNLVDIIKNLPEKCFKETGTHSSLHVVNPIAEKKRRNKSKSPAHISKTNSSGIGKLLQLPGKLAFWSKNDDKNKDNISTSSGDCSRRSSTVEKTVDEFQSCNALNELPINRNRKVSEDQLSFKDAEFIENEVSHNIIEKSDELQKLIEAKLESHPEYKIVSLHEEVPTTSKSTDV